MHPMAQTDTQTDGHSELETESAQWADSLKAYLKLNVSLSERVRKD